MGILVGFSQGNVIARGYLQEFNSPVAKKYISIDGPLAGEWAGVPQACGGYIHPSLGLHSTVMWCNYIYMPRVWGGGNPHALMSKWNSMTADQSQLTKTEEVVLMAGLTDPIIRPKVDSDMKLLTGSAHFGPRDFNTGQKRTLAQTEWYEKKHVRNQGHVRWWSYLV